LVEGPGRRALGACATRAGGAMSARPADPKSARTEFRDDEARVMRVRFDLRLSNGAVCRSRR
jgi:hypothetical protein